jgi:tetratricopeptide (TPR) repeat protein
MAWSLSSGVYSYVEEGAAAVERAQRGLRLSPADCQAFFYLMLLGQAHYACGNYDEAIIWARKTATLNGRLCANLRILAAASAAVGDAEQARSAAEALLDVQPRFRLSQYAQRCPYDARLRARFVDQLRAAGLPD